MTVEADAAIVREQLEELYAAFEAADLDRMALIWADGDLADSAACTHPGWATLRGRDAVLRSWAMIMANTTYIQFVITDVELDLAGDIAVLTCVENIITAAADLAVQADEEEPADPTAFAGARGVATNVFRRGESGWRLWVRHGSPVLTGIGPETTQD